MSGQDTNTPSAIMSENQKQNDTSSADIQKYLLNLGIGMQGGRNLQESLSGGLSRAGQGMLQDIEKQQHKKTVADILGNKDLAKLSPDDMYKTGIDLISSGEADLQGIGQHLVTTAMSKQPSKQFISTTQNIGGKEIPGQYEVSTGQFTPYSSDLVNGPKVTYVPELQSFVDQYGNKVTLPGQQSQGIQTGTTEQQSNIPNLGDTSISRMTPKQQSELEQGVAKIKTESQAKDYVAAQDYFTPENIAERQGQADASKNLLSDLKTQIGEAHKGFIGSNIPAIQKARTELGAESTSNLYATARNLVATKIGQMKSAGVVSAGQLNSDKDIDLQTGAIFDVNAPESVQLKQLERLQQDALLVDKKISEKDKHYGQVLSGTYKPEAKQSSNQNFYNTKPTDETPKPEIVIGGDGKKYIKLPNGNYRLAQ
jgi:hypothetical protein